MKICPKCKENKSLHEYHNNKNKKYGKETYCKICLNKNAKNKYIEDPRFEYHKKYSKNEKTKQYQKEYRLKNKEKIKQVISKWYYDNKERHLHKTTQNKKIKKNIDPSFKIADYVRSRILSALKKQRINKNNKTLELIGCSFKQYKQHLESQFKPEMTWENHGEIWEIDHIKPCSSFDLTDIEQQKQCFHYTNTQPLFKTTSIADSLGYNEVGNRNKSNNYD